MAAHSAPRKNASRPVITIIVVVAVVAILAIIATIAIPLFWTQPKVDAPVRTAAPKPALELPKDVSQKFALRVFLEQVESQDNLGRLVDGELTSISAEDVVETDDGAIVYVTAHFSDGTSGPGYLRLVKKESGWYYASVAGGNEAAAGLSSTVSDGKVEDVQRTDDEVIAHVGSTVFDSGVINAIISQSAKNASLAKDLVAGEISAISFGKPKSGAGTVTIPATIDYRTGADRKGQTVLVAKTIDGRQYYFMTTLKTD
ncbi:MAG TPA: hypothetical protein VFG89_00025 [Coriobacteriia bacterium]|nr:hypothetical protein [Coriobacteriia bacterium]